MGLNGRYRCVIALLIVAATCTAAAKGTPVLSARRALMQEPSPTPVNINIIPFPSPEPNAANAGGAATGGTSGSGNAPNAPTASPAVNAANTGSTTRGTNAPPASPLAVSTAPAASPATNAANTGGPSAPTASPVTNAGTTGGNAPAASPPTAEVTANASSPSPATAAGGAGGGSNAPAAGGSNAPSGNNATGGGSNAPAAGGSNAPSGNNATGGGSNAPAAGGNNAPGGSSGGSRSSNSGFPGYPQSGGILYPELATLLVSIQEAHLYKDSKTAVDLVLKQSVPETLTAYQQLLSSNASITADASNTTGSGGGSAAIGVAALQEFVNRTMDPAGSDLITCQAVDWTPEPQGFLRNLQGAGAAGTAGDAGGEAANASSSGISNATELRQFGLQLHQLWGLLCRQVSPNVSANPERHSLLPLKEPTIVPGDRFRETYYWDSYWVIRGLLVSGMTQSATNLVSNLMSMLQAVGHVPNGARVYYINRSQPPLLSAMVRDVYSAQMSAAITAATEGRNSSKAGGNSGSSSTNATEFLAKALPLLVKEHVYWTTGNKAVVVTALDGSTHDMSRYWANWTSPRPESYREDAELARNVTGTLSPDNAAAAVLYRDLASGAESGWDYSSRWFGDGKTLATVRTTQIIPADLNAFLYQMEANIAWAAGELGQQDIAQRFTTLAQERRNSINKLLWDNEAGMWRDGILQQQNSTTTTGSDTANTTASNSTAGGSGVSGGSNSGTYTLIHNPGAFASNFIPLWAGVAEGDLLQGGRVVEALQSSGLVQPAGIATTLYNTGQQWDWPNGWPPLQHMLVEGARKYGGNVGQDFACNMARTWLGVNMRVYNQTGAMHEKYDVTQPKGDIGGGGEYAPQVGFGWSNGVALDFLANYC